MLTKYAFIHINLQIPKCNAFLGRFDIASVASQVTPIRQKRAGAPLLSLFAIVRKVKPNAIRTFVAATAIPSATDECGALKYGKVAKVSRNNCGAELACRIPIQIADRPTIDGNHHGLAVVFVRILKHKVRMRFVIDAIAGRLAANLDKLSLIITLSDRLSVIGARPFDYRY